MNKLKKLQITDFVVISVLGTLLHFAYDFFNRNKIIGIFSAVNESTWEHLKLLFFPALFMTVAGVIVTGEKYKGYITARAISVWLGMLSIVTLFYTYSGILGRNLLWADILIFYIGCFVTSIFTYYLTDKKINSNMYGYLIFAITFIMFVAFTFSPPEIGLFENPLK